MIIFWRGWGILVLLLGMGTLALTELATESLFHDETYYQVNGWPKLLGCLLAASIIWFVGRRLNAPLIESAHTRPGEELPKGHSFFFIRMEHWAPIFVAIGIAMMFAP